MEKSELIGKVPDEKGILVHPICSNPSPGKSGKESTHYARNAERNSKTKKVGMPRNSDKVPSKRENENAFTKKKRKEAGEWSTTVWKGAATD